MLILTTSINAFPFGSKKSTRLTDTFFRLIIINFSIRTEHAVSFCQKWTLFTNNTFSIQTFTITIFTDTFLILLAIKRVFSTIMLTFSLDIIEQGRIRTLNAFILKHYIVMRTLTLTTKTNKWRRNTISWRLRARTISHEGIKVRARLPIGELIHINWKRILQTLCQYTISIYIIIARPTKAFSLVFICLEPTIIIAIDLLIAVRLTFWFTVAWRWVDKSWKWSCFNFFLIFLTDFRRIGLKSF